MRKYQGRKSLDLALLEIDTKITVLSSQVQSIFKDSMKSFYDKDLKRSQKIKKGYELLQNLTIAEQFEVSDGQVQSLEEIWYGKEIQKVRRSHYKNMLDEVKVCSSCTYTDTFVWRKL